MLACDCQGALGQCWRGRGVNYSTPTEVARTWEDQAELQEQARGVRKVCHWLGDWVEAGSR
jgi:hypothetical protein